MNIASSNRSTHSPMIPNLTDATRPGVFNRGNTQNGQESNWQSPREELNEPMTDAVRTLLLGVGEDPQREGLLKTPKRVAEAMRFLTSGY